MVNILKHACIHILAPNGTGIVLKLHTLRLACVTVIWYD